MATRRHKRPFEAGCVRQVGLPCTVEGTHVNGCRVMGPIQLPSLENARKYAQQAIDGGNKEFLELVAKHMATWGGAVWHSCAELLDRPCRCAGCTDQGHPRHAWCKDSTRIYAEGPYPKVKITRGAGSSWPSDWTFEIV